MKLTANAYNALNKISSATKSDWFWIDQDCLGEDIVVDLEFERVTPWREALLELFDAWAACPEENMKRAGLTEDEQSEAEMLYGLAVEFLDGGKPKWN